MNLSRLALQPLLISLLGLVAVGCELNFGDQSAEGGIGGSGSGNGQYAEGGMGGSGSGTTTGYGSIYVNDDRYYQIAEEAEIRLDGEMLHPGSVNQTGQALPLGMVVEFLLGEDASEDMTGGTVIALEANHRLIGPARVSDDGSPLQVLGQEVRTDFRTRYAGLEKQDIHDGTWLKIDGHLDHAGRVLATRIAATEPGTAMQIIGRVTANHATSLEIGPQSVDLSHASLECDTPLAGREVLVRAPDGMNQQGSLLASDVRCLDDGLSLFSGRDDIPAEVPATAEGFILDLTLVNEETLVEINLGGQRVDLTNVLPLLATTVASLELGTHLEVDGILDTRTGVLEAKRLRLRDPLNLFEVIAPVASLTEGTVQLLGMDVIGLPAATGNVLDSLGSDGWAHVTGFVLEGEIYAFAASTVAEQNVSLTAAVDAVDNDLQRIFIQDVPYLLDTATSLTLLGSDGVVTGLVNDVADLLSGAVCTLLPSLCPADPNEVDLETLAGGKLARLNMATAGQDEPASLSQGHLTLISPPATPAAE